MSSRVWAVMFGNTAALAAMVVLLLNLDGWHRLWALVPVCALHAFKSGDTR